MSKALDVLAYVIIGAAVLAAVLITGTSFMTMIIEYPWMSLKITSLLLFCMVTYWAAYRIWRDKF